MNNCCVGITPACAGNRDKLLKELKAHNDHPRMCGEQRFSISVYTSSLGSPPHVRGTVYRCMPHI